MRSLAVPLILSLLASPRAYGGGEDADGDGVSASEDCDDNNDDIRPGAPETCDGVDENCDGVVDDGLGAHSYPDADGDGFGDPDGQVDGCAFADGLIGVGGDCDDADPTVHPYAVEVRDDIDQDCDPATAGPRGCDVGSTASGGLWAVLGALLGRWRRGSR